MNRKPTEPRRGRLWLRLVLAGAASTAFGVVAVAGVSEAHTTATTATSTTFVVSTATLPETGSNSGIQLAIGLTAFAVGTALVVFARRRAQPSPDV